MKYIKMFSLFEKLETKSLYVDSSTIPNSGKGLFAKRDFKKGEFICKFTGEIIDSDELYKRDIGGPRSHYFIDMGNKTLDVYKSKGLARYANDAEGLTKIKGKKNNSSIYMDDDEKYVYIAATKNIKAGEEIFVSYGKDYWKNIDL